MVAWATAHGFLNGATLTGVMQAMQTNGFPLNNAAYDDGPYNSVDWTNATTLQSAISSHGPVKIGVGRGISNRIPTAWSHQVQAVGRCTITQKTNRRITA